jgi:hypothetical protein
VQCAAGSRGIRSLVVIGVSILLAPPTARAVPSFARQTKLTCNACHTQFPELNSFGREFKLNGYTLRGIEGLQNDRENGSRDLDLPLFSLFSAMFQGSLTSTRKHQEGLDGTLGTPQNQTTELPQELSFFVAGEITNHFGAFVQTTYSGNDGTFGIDNVDLRYANHTTFHEKPLIYGLSFNNNPTVSDLWNSTPVWRFPYAESDIAPTPTAAPMIAGGMEQAVAGLTAYAYWNDTLYLEAGAYRSAPQGVGGPLNGANTSNAIDGVAPYFRVALQKQYQNHNFMIGAFGLLSDVQPGALTGTPLQGASDRYDDVGLDANYQVDLGKNDISVHASWIHESTNLNALQMVGAAFNRSDPLDTFNLAATFHLGTRWGFTIAPFLTTGKKDSLLYAPEPITGSRNGSPNSNGITFEVDLNEWQNLRLALQYTAYFRFNGSDDNYDGFGRNASDNNTIYLLGWAVY